MAKWNWTAVGAVGTLIGGIAAIIAILLSRPAATPADARATNFYIDGCEQRFEAINSRPALSSGQGPASQGIIEPQANWCRCTGRILEANFDSATVRHVGEWFQAVALGGAERGAEEDFFEQLPAADRLRMESAYDFAARQCNQASGR